MYVESGFRTRSLLYAYMLRYEEQINMKHRIKILPDQAHRAIPIWQWVQKLSIAHCRPMFD